MGSVYIPSIWAGTEPATPESSVASIGLCPGRERAKATVFYFFNDAVDRQMQKGQSNPRACKIEVGRFGEDGFKAHGGEKALRQERKPGLHGLRREAAGQQTTDNFAQNHGRYQREKVGGNRWDMPIKAAGIVCEGKADKGFGFGQSRAGPQAAFGAPRQREARNPSQNEGTDLQVPRSQGDQE